MPRVNLFAVLVRTLSAPGRFRRHYPSEAAFEDDVWEFVRTWARRLVRSRLGISLLIVLVGAQLAVAQGLKTSPGEILSNPDRFDHQVVTIDGTVTNLQERVSKAGNAYYTFDLSDGRQAIRVFSFGKASCRADGATVEGVFTKVKQQGRYTFYNEIEARRVACR